MKKVLLITTLAALMGITGCRGPTEDPVVDEETTEEETGGETVVIDNNLTWGTAEWGGETKWGTGNSTTNTQTL